jgi:hypothetical protein
MWHRVLFEIQRTADNQKNLKLCIILIVYHTPYLQLCYHRSSFFYCYLEYLDFNDNMTCLRLVSVAGSSFFYCYLEDLVFNDNMACLRLVLVADGSACLG